MCIQGHQNKRTIKGGRIMWKNFIERLWRHPKTTLTGLATALGGLFAVFGYHADPTVVSGVVSLLAGAIGILAKDR